MPAERDAPRFLATDYSARLTIYRKLPNIFSMQMPNLSGLKPIVAGIGVIGSFASIIATGAMFYSVDTPPSETAPTQTSAAAPVEPSPTPVETPQPQPVSPDPVIVTVAAPLPVPPISELLYSEARELLLRSGWRPAKNPANRTGRMSQLSGNGPEVLSEGWLEVQDCSGSGEAPCRFAFRDDAGRILIAVTIGEFPNMRVNDYWFADEVER